MERIPSVINLQINPPTMKLRIINSSITLKTIGILQLLGGVAGLYIMANLMLRTEVISGPYLLVMLIGVGLFIYSIICGKKLLSNDSKQMAIVYSIINYFFQLIHWSFFGWGLTYVSGLSFAIGIKESALHFDFALASNFQISINSGSEILFKINLVALLVLIILFDVLLELIKIKKAQMEVETVEVSNDLARI